MTQSAMCIPLWPARNGNTAHLVMCPFAGGSSSAFRHWQAEQLADCALSLVTWPGRDSPSPSGTAQKHYHNWRHCWRTSWKHPYRLTRRFLLAGHSMGAQVAFETCRLLEQRGLAPQGLIISGCHAPHLHSERQLSHRDDADFIAELIDIGGCSPELRENQELMSLVSSSSAR
ncbi:yersiniabactin siderophore biosynthetic protein [Escherichia coli]|uniref:Yersiniabactin siderophore biosynthetic protein n=1 Tax=Escherichia coli TaxID=562 RepID=A0A376VJN4_ECOLX|nr:yersiniabactin siderophore biosynthetic protein [Escherichia coli]